MYSRKCKLFLVWKKKDSPKVNSLLWRNDIFLSAKKPIHHKSSAYAKKERGENDMQMKKKRVIGFSSHFVHRSVCLLVIPICERDFPTWPLHAIPCEVRRAVKITNYKDKFLRPFLRFLVHCIIQK